MSACEEHEDKSRETKSANFSRRDGATHRALPQKYDRGQPECERGVWWWWWRWRTAGKRGLWWCTCVCGGAGGVTRETEVRA